ncbi:hypothetical protein GCM10009549_19710 [Streptomyces thermoalcalitolerans]|uniref:Uncharacterized protein n=1 Tax=Streptomyces thermoalcalitolerans TaxID=65605 RepID=A0ABP3YY27_9ACTN
MRPEGSEGPEGVESRGCGAERHGRTVPDRRDRRAPAAVAVASGRRAARAPQRHPPEAHKRFRTPLKMVNKAVSGALCAQPCNPLLPANGLGKGVGRRRAEKESFLCAEDVRGAGTPFLAWTKSAVCGGMQP